MVQHVFIMGDNNLKMIENTNRARMNTTHRVTVRDLPDDMEQNGIAIDQLLVASSINVEYVHPLAAVVTQRAPSLSARARRVHVPSTLPTMIPPLGINRVARPHQPVAYGGCAFGCSGLVSLLSARSIRPLVFPTRLQYALRVTFRRKTP
jgi:hypothetical protein